MTREVVKRYEYISDDTKRAVTFKKRKSCIFNKIQELSILCGIDVGAIVYSGPSDPEPEVWPDHEGVQQVIERCQSRSVSKGTMKREESLQKRINNGKELLMRRRKANDEEEISQLMIQCMEGKTVPPLTNWSDMKMLVEQRLKNMNRTVQESGKEVEFRVSASSMSEELPVFRGNEMLTSQFQQFNIDNVPAPPPISEGLYMPYSPTPPSSEGLEFNVQNENLSCQNLQYGMYLGNMEDFIGIGAYEMPGPSHNANYPHVPSFYNPFSS